MEKTFQEWNEFVLKNSEPTEVYEFYELNAGIHEFRRQASTLLGIEIQLEERSNALFTKWSAFTRQAMKELDEDHIVVVRKQFLRLEAILVRIAPHLEKDVKKIIEKHPAFTGEPLKEFYVRDELMRLTTKSDLTLAQFNAIWDIVRAGNMAETNRRRSSNPHIMKLPGVKDLLETLVFIPKNPLRKSA